MWTFCVKPKLTVQLGITMDKDPSCSDASDASEFGCVYEVCRMFCPLSSACQFDRQFLARGSEEQSRRPPLPQPALDFTQGSKGYPAYPNKLLKTSKTTQNNTKQLVQRVLCIMYPPSS